MARKRRSRTRPLAALGCLTIVGLLVAAGFLVAPRVKEFFAPSNPYGPQVPIYGPSQPMPVTRGNIAEGFSAYGMVKASRTAKLAFEKASGEVAMAMADVGMYVTADSVLVELDRSALERDVALARADLLKAQEELDALESGENLPTQRLALQVELAAAEQALEDARAALAAFDRGMDTPATRRSRAAQELQSARAALEALTNDKARQEQIDYLQWIYNQSEVKHGEMTAIPNPSEQDRDVEWLLRLDMQEKGQSLEMARLQFEADKHAAEAKVASAAQALAAADAALAHGAMDVQRGSLLVDIAAAEAKVAVLTEQLAALDSGATDSALAKARAEVLKATGDLEDAEAALQNATLVAPFDGVITQSNVVTGMRVSAGSVLVTLEDASSQRVVAQVSEVDIAKVAEGMPVQVSFDAMMGQPPLTGTVESVPLYGKYQNGMTIFELPIAFGEGAEVPLFQGMSANIVFPISTKENVLTVPAAAVMTDDQGTFVALQHDDGQSEKVYVQVGATNGVYTEIVSGVEEGAMVLVPMYGPRGQGGIYGGMIW